MSDHCLQRRHCKINKEHSAEQRRAAELALGLEMRDLWGAHVRAACAAYRAHFGRRAPGSFRTSRLRKKRERAVLSWFDSQLEGDK